MLRNEKFERPLIDCPPLDLNMIENSILKSELKPAALKAAEKAGLTLAEWMEEAVTAKLKQEGIDARARGHLRARIKRSQRAGKHAGTAEGCLSGKSSSPH
jgi:hypothetical protein